MDQFKLWRKGLIDDYTYKLWMTYRREEWAENKALRKITYKDSFKRIAEMAPLDNDFLDFMQNAVFQQNKKIDDYKEKFYKEKFL